MRIPPKFILPLALAAILPLALRACADMAGPPPPPAPADGGQPLADASDLPFQGKPSNPPGDVPSGYAPGAAIYDEHAQVAFNGSADTELKSEVLGSPAFVSPRPSGATTGLSDKTTMIYGLLRTDPPARPVTGRIWRGSLAAQKEGLAEFVLDVAPWKDDSMRRLYRSTGRFPPVCAGFAWVDGVLVRSVRFQSRTTRAGVDSDAPEHLRMEASAYLAPGRHDVAFAWRCVPSVEETLKGPEAERQEIPSPGFVVKAEARMPGSGTFVPAFPKMNH